MEIVFVKTEERSNFDFCSKVFGGKKVLNGFNKLEETMLFEPIVSKEFEVQDVSFLKEITADLFLSYPLSVVVKETITFKTLHDLITAIRKAYKQIYKEEKESLTKIKGSSKLYNRGTSDGKYGIWGHGIHDLIIEAIQVLEGEDRPVVRVAIGS